MTHKHSVADPMKPWVLTMFPASWEITGSEQNIGRENVWSLKEAINSFVHLSIHTFIDLANTTSEVIALKPYSLQTSHFLCVFCSWSLRAVEGDTQKCHPFCWLLDMNDSAACLRSSFTFAGSPGSVFPQRFILNAFSP